MSALEYFAETMRGGKVVSYTHESPSHVMNVLSMVAPDVFTPKEPNAAIIEIIDYNILMESIRVARRNMLGDMGNHWQVTVTCYVGAPYAVLRAQDLRG